MSDYIISVEGLGKKYRITHVNQGRRYTALRDVFAETVKRGMRRIGSLLPHGGAQPAERNHEPSSEDFWALKGVSFEIKPGDVVGIIGRNGAGKSTLLKILSRITEPTEGRVRIKGRVASLLEVGTGFHPELTGRENISLNGAILGMSRVEIRSKFDEIVAFAEVEKFLDTPVKRYSSGMYVRLAFAVAAHLQPEILVVDEVLAVGDAQFQKKCLGKMQEVSQQQGRTVLFVSHNMAAITQLTKTAIVLNKGAVSFHGPTEEATHAYAGTAEAESAVFFDVEHQPRKYLGTQSVRFLSLRFDRVAPIFSFEEDFSFIARVRALENVERVRFSMTMFTAEGTPVGSAFSAECSVLRRGESMESRLSISNPRLAPGHYYCGVGVGKGNNRTGHVDYDVVMDTLFFEVTPERGEDGTVASWTRGWGAINFPELTVESASNFDPAQA